jgi:hypothetical protein
LSQTKNLLSSLILDYKLFTVRDIFIPAAITGTNLIFLFIFSLPKAWQQLFPLRASFSKVRSFWPEPLPELLQVLLPQLLPQPLPELLQVLLPQPLPELLPEL